MEQGGLCNSCLAKEQLFDFKALTLVSKYVCSDVLGTYSKTGFWKCCNEITVFQSVKIKSVRIERGKVHTRLKHN